MNIGTPSQPSAQPNRPRGPRTYQSKSLSLPPKSTLDSQTPSFVSESHHGSPTQGNSSTQPSPVSRWHSTASPETWQSFNSRVSVDDAFDRNYQTSSPVSKSHHSSVISRRFTESSATRPPIPQNTSSYQTSSPISESHHSPPTPGSPFARQARIPKRRSTAERQLFFEVKDVRQKLGSNICPLAVTLINLTKTPGGQDFLNQIKITSTKNHGFLVKFPGQPRSIEVKQEELSQSNLITENTTLKALELAYEGVKNRSIKKKSNEIGISREELGNGMETPHEVLERIFGHDKVTQLSESGGLSLSFINRGEHWLSAEKNDNGSFKTINPMYTNELNNTAYHPTYMANELSRSNNGPKLVTLHLKA